MCLICMNHWRGVAAFSWDASRCSKFSQSAEQKNYAFSSKPRSQRSQAHSLFWNVLNVHTVFGGAGVRATVNGVT